MIKNNCLYLLIIFFCSCDKPKESHKLGEYQGVVAFDERSLAFETTGRLQTTTLRRGAEVKSGDVVAVLDDSLLRPLLAARQAEKRAAEAKLALLEAGARPEDLATVSAQLKAAKATEQTVTSNLNRQQTLVTSGAIGTASLDDLSAQLSRATAERRALEQRWSLLHSGARSQEIDAAQAQIEAASAAITAEEERLRRYSLTSPFSGYLSEVFFDPGEIVAAGAPLATVLDLAHPYVDVFVSQAQLSGLSLQKSAKLQSDSLSAPLCGAIEELGKQAEFTPKFIFSEQERPNIVFRVRVRISDPSRQLHAGVPAFVSFEDCAPIVTGGK